VDLDRLTELHSDGARRIASAGDLDALRAVETELVGKQGSITLLNRTLGSLDPEQRKVVCAQINSARSELVEAVEARRVELTAASRRVQLAAERLDLTEVLPDPTRTAGHLHLISSAVDELCDIFVAMGFTVHEGPEAETDYYNFEALNFPKGHPARSMQDSFFLDLGEPGEVVLRTHTSPMQIRLMEEAGGNPPIYAVMPGRCYRRDTLSARHLVGFHQFEALVIDEGISLGHLAGTIEAFVKSFFHNEELKGRLRPGYFPFTEPSAEFEITCPFCTGAGCRVCSHTGWFELGGCGMVHPNVMRAGGVDPERWTGFAWGFGIDRLVMNRHNIDDIRHFLDNDVRFLRQF
jgi:phenylalanyl-tRNA synthetase alpha chain